MRSLLLIVALLAVASAAHAADCEVVAVVKVRNVYAGQRTPALRIETAQSGQTIYYWHDIASRRWWRTDRIQAVVRDSVSADAVPSVVRRAALLIRP